MGEVGEQGLELGLGPGERGGFAFLRFWSDFDVFDEVFEDSNFFGGVGGFFGTVSAAIHGAGEAFIVGAFQFYLVKDNFLEWVETVGG